VSVWGGDGGLIPGMLNAALFLWFYTWLVLWC
jgi:hypothetical protein